MIQKIQTFTPKGTIDLPTSKSYAHRALITAFLCHSKTTIHDITFSDDINATLQALMMLGANVEIGQNYVTFIEFNELPKEVIVNAHESGSTLRFLIPFVSYLVPHVKFVGAKSLFKRPLSIYEDIFIKQDIKYEKGEDYLEIFSSMRIENFEVYGNISSQFITGLIYLLSCQKNTNYIRVIPPFESKEYVDITLDILREFGIDFVKNNNDFYLNKITYKKTNYYIEKDYSQLAFFAVLGAIKGEIKVNGLNLNSLQGDKQILNILKRMNANIKIKDDQLIVTKSMLKPIEIDLSSCIDLGPILFVLCALCSGKSKIYNASRLRIKESDRINSMEVELKKAGVDITSTYDTVFINGKTNYQGNYEFDCHNDHRIAMALSVFATINEGECTLNGAECINKSYPDFYCDLLSLRGVTNVKK